MPLLIRNARVVTAAPAKPEAAVRGEALGELSVIPRADVLIVGERIQSIRPIAVDAQGKTARRPPPPAETTIIEAAGRVVMPGFVDCHTHACWAGQRFDEWDMKRRGVPYLDILKRGGGIMSTVRAVRAASQEELTELLLERLGAMLRCGTTTVEIKSGYGLSTEGEIKMLRAIRAAAERWPGTVRMTALLGHAIDEDIPGFVGVTLRQTLPRVMEEFGAVPGLMIDAFCERSAWSLEQCVLLMNRARELGVPMRVHADQFNSLGMVPVAIRSGARSVDHLEATTAEDLAALAASETAGVFLPMSPFHLGSPQGKALAFAKQGGWLCLASNYNPGSGPSPSIPLVIGMAIRLLGLSFGQCLTAVTHNPAILLGLADRGKVQAGQRADLLLLRHTDERAMGFELGEPGVDMVIAGGKVVHETRREGSSER